mmetsp:Transcript_18942/g.21221  ORF Transcript_18942/g.21221 Transcript_18942/m.21221 type:complete len:144 (+) Transcript_18942:27-458(+)|eukprot:CAMPEP_0205823340 /NCGR_PEP_ID=MMETSP0206-20130828/16112_1 /ASSEMBLY_ACC=CAM_ASM_000279 /TAXON_ID=36767 /ORGANISM="Euplotes focardii, Strain TN1" /LENGTH=143 /DNA_ID=CAMNT_0053120409 /DNA_START=27 /DNA_END=458 /DNA_ORIENTATION=-
MKGLLVCMLALASLAQAQVQRWEWECGPRLCRVVATPHMIQTAGIVSTDTTPDVARQTQNILSQLDALLATAGGRKQDITHVAIWLVDIENDFAAFNAVYDRWLLPSAKPARATVGAPLARAELLVEIQITAWRRPQLGEDTQ